MFHSPETFYPKVFRF